MEPEYAVDRFKTFLRFRTITSEGPQGAYHQAIAWLDTWARDIGLETKVYEHVENKPVLLCKWTGTDPAAPAVMLNSHYDVVPVFPEHWTVDPFAAVEKDGWIYGRGAQDMKCVCIQHMLAVEALKKAGHTPRRTVYIMYVPDEEIGGVAGMGEMVKHGVIASLNLGVALDEGLASEGDNTTVFYGERALWWLHVRATGDTGHASRFIKKDAMRKLIRSVQQFLDFRDEQEALLGHDGCKHAQAKKLGDVVTLNLTALKGGVTGDGGKTYNLNVIPQEAEAGFDVRIPPSVPLEEMEAKFKEWTKEEGVDYVFKYRTPAHWVTAIEGGCNHWWNLFEKTCQGQGITLEPEVFPAATDSRYLRELGIPALGFSPMPNTPILLHDHDERLHRDTFVKGVGVFESIISALSTADVLPHEA
eukprot:TRINITY_DN17110_c0_g1_i1.p1 TRINITY_DN17110_c0_g1~~TRINITY_DN17110_c0_g1_i1.p1  ORF type:complete len:417 (+),score=104.40 TRINITY_DN17110_c0_g1_i1:95-1345(+)